MWVSLRTRQSSSMATGVPWRGEPDVQGVGGGVGDDVAGAGEGGADQGVGFVVGAGVAVSVTIAHAKDCAVL